MKKKLTAKIDEDLRDKINELAKKKGINLSEMTTRMCNVALEADKFVEEMRCQ